VEFAARAGNKDTAGDVAFAVFHALYDPRRLAALRAVSAFGSIHYFLAVRRFGDLSHLKKSPGCRVSAASVAGGKCGGGIGDSTLKRCVHDRNYDFTLNGQFSPPGGGTKKKIVLYM
jgi:hypothetical protein